MPRVLHHDADIAHVVLFQRLLKNDADLSNPMNVLDKGYAMARKDGSWKDRAAAFSAGDSLDLRFKDGNLVCLVQEVNIDE